MEAASQIYLALFLLRLDALLIRSEMKKVDKSTSRFIAFQAHVYLQRSLSPSRQIAWSLSVQDIL